MVNFERHLIAIGKVASNFALLELLTAHACWAFLGTDPQASHIVTTNLNFSRILDVVGALANLRISDMEARESVFRVLQEAQASATLRNQILHSAYALPDDASDPPQGTFQRVHRRSSRKKGLAADATTEGTVEIEQAVKQIYAVIESLQRLPNQIEKDAPDVARRLRETPRLGHDAGA